MTKKINCKHGLNSRQEIEARRLRVKLEQGNEDVLSKYHELWINWMKVPNISFEEYIREQNNVYYSAFIRACQINETEIIYMKIVKFRR